MHRDRGQVAVVIALTALVMVAAVIRVVGLRDWVLTGDDALHAEIAWRTSAWDTVVRAVREDAHPPFFYLVLRAAMSLGLRTEPLLLRIPALSAGLLCIVSFYVLGRVVSASRAGGLALAAIAAFSHVLVSQSQVVRHYTLLLLLSSAALACILSSLKRGPIGYFIFAFLVTQTHYVASLGIGVVAFVGLVTRIREYRRQRRRVDVITLATWCVVHVAIALVMAFERYVSIKKPPWNDRYLAQFMIDGARQSFGGAVDTLSGHHLGVWTPAPWLLVIPFGIGVVLLARRRRLGLLVVSLAPIGAALALAVAHVYPFLGPPRYSVWVFPMALIPVAVAFGELGRLPVRSRVAVGFAILAALVTNASLARNGRLWHPNEIRLADVWAWPKYQENATLAIDWAWRTDEQDRMFDLARRYAAADAPITISWAEDRRDRLARILGWESRSFPVPHQLAGGYEIVSSSLLSAIGRSSTKNTWVLVRSMSPTEAVQLERGLAGSPCLSGARLYRTDFHLLIGVDGDAVRARIRAGECE